MKKICLISILITLSVALFAAPFGLKMGMTLKEIEKECIGRAEHNKDDIYFITPKKSHPLFTFYAVYVNEKVGLYKIRAVSDFIACNNYGTELKNAFENFKDRISKTYGEPEIFDRIDRGSYMKDDSYWMMALQDGARELYAVWGGDSNLQDNLIGISLQCKALNDILHYGDGLLILDYDFKNTSSVQDEQDSVF